MLEELRRTARFIQFAVVAAMEAVQKSGLDIESIAPMCGVEIGSGVSVGPRWGGNSDDYRWVRGCCNALGGRVVLCRSVVINPKR